MKIILLRSNLKVGLDAIERGVGENVNLPILKNVLIKTDKGLINIRSTNLEIAVNYLLPGKVIENGGLVVPFSTLTAIINNLDNERINLEVKNTNLIIKTDNYEAEITGFKDDDFPIIPEIKNNLEFIEISQNILRDAFSKVINAAGFSEIRPEISGVLISYGRDFLKLTTTDSFRLAEKTIPKNAFNTKISNEFKVIIPLRTAQEILKAAGGDGLIKIYIDPSQILFKTDELEIISRLIDGKFPDYEPIVPSKNETEVIVNKTLLLNALKLSGVFSGRSNAVVVKLNKKTLEVYSSSQGIGENRYLIPVKTDGGLFEASFNWRFLTDGFKNQGSEDVVWGVNNDNKPSVIKSLNDPSYFYLLMPVRN